MLNSICASLCSMGLILQSARLERTGENKSKMYINYGCQFNVFEIIKIVNPTWTLNFEVWEIFSRLSEGSPLTLVSEDQGKSTSSLGSNVVQ